MPNLGVGQQVKVWLPQPLYDALRAEAKDTGRSMSEIGREEIAERYRRQAEGVGIDIGEVKVSSS